MSKKKQVEKQRPQGVPKPGETPVATRPALLTAGGVIYVDEILQKVGTLTLLMGNLQREIRNQKATIQQLQAENAKLQGRKDGGGEEAKKDEAKPKA